MKNNPSADVQHPLMLKLFFVFLVTGILILSAVAGHMAWMVPKNPVPARLFRLNLEQYTISLANEIASSSSQDQARQLASDLGIAVRIEKPNRETWESTSDMPSQSYISAHLDSVNGEIHSGHFHREIFSQIQKDGVLYTFYLLPPKPVRALIRQIMWLIGTLTLILIFSFMAVHRLIRPMKVLMSGVAAVSEGQLDYQVSLPRGDEFEYLGRAFNQMTNRVREMLQARERLLLDLSHELRSPLTRMLVAGEFIEKPELRASIKEDLHEMEFMVNEVLEGARLGSLHGGLEVKPVDLKALLTNLVKKHSAEKPGLVFKVSEIIPTIEADEFRLQSACRNLIENALKYSREQQLPVEVHLRNFGGGVQIEICDHGIGIPKDKHDLIFEPFYRIDESRTRSTGGFGLGLNICKKIVEAHRGRISLESEPGKGTKFYIWLPARHVADVI